MTGDTLLFAHGHLLRVLAARWLGQPASGGGMFALGTATIGILGWDRANPRHRDLERGLPPGVIAPSTTGPPARADTVHDAGPRDFRTYRPATPGVTLHRKVEPP